MAITPNKLVEKSSTEHSIQTAFFAALAIVKLPNTKWIHAIPNGGERNQIVAGKMKAEGARKGVWDVFVPLKRKGYAGLYIEFKVPERRGHKAGGLSAEQIEFGKHCLAQGYHMELCYTWQEAAIALCKYLEIEFQEDVWNGARTAKNDDA